MTRYLVPLGLAGGIITCSLATPTPGLAQIVPDATLPKNTIVTPDGNTIRIDGGTRVGDNLFHSFEEFSLSTDATAFFNNATNVQNILSRVTGGNISNIDGLIEANGLANLFLVNPNGIVFGPNARLNIGGSFIGSTADSVLFGGGGEFSAVNPDGPPLLTVNVPIGLQLGPNPQPIINSSRAAVGEETAGLTVAEGKTLALVGGDVGLTGGILQAPGGRVELGGLRGSGTASLNANGSVSLTEGVARGDVSLSDGAEVIVSAGGGGSIGINARNINVSQGSNIFAGIADQRGTVESSAGDINLNATGAIAVTDGSQIRNLVGTGASGRGGSVNIQTNTLSVRDGAQISTNIQGPGAAGNVLVVATELVEVAGSSLDGESASGLFADVQPGATGRGGNLTVSTLRLRAIDGGQIRVDSLGAGDAGDLTVTARDIELIGRSSNNELSSGLFASVEASGNGGNITVRSDRLRAANQGRVSADVNEGGSGNAGNVIINATEQLLVEGGAVISAGTFAEGNAGELIVRAPEIQVIGASADGRFPSGMFASSEPGAIGSAGNLTVETQRLRVANGGGISARSSSAGAGNMRIIASEIEVIGRDLNNQFPSGLDVSAGQEATGKGGNLTIETEKLRVVDAGLISVTTFGAADAGDLRITASDIEIIGESVDTIFASSVSASAEIGSTGNGGNVIIQTERLLIADSALIVVSTFGSGKAGDLTVIASDVELVGVSANGEFASLMTASVERGATGNGGNLTVETERLRLADGSQISSATFGVGNGGNVTIRAKSIELSGITPDSEVATGFATAAQLNITGRGGDLTVETEELIVRDDARISSATVGVGRAGSINITASGSVELIDALIITVSSGPGDAGDIEITASSILMNNVGGILTETSSTEGGNIKLKANNLLQLRRGSTISTTAGTEQAGGNGGNITINSPLVLPLTAENNEITANAFSGNGGVLEINTEVDFTSALFDPPEAGVDAASLIDTRCLPGNENRSEYINAGRGGTPPNPREPLNNSSGWTDDRYSATSQETPTANSNSQELVEARGWIVNAKGQIELVANPELFVPTNSGFVPVRCVRGGQK